MDNKLTITLIILIVLTSILAHISFYEIRKLETRIEQLEANR